MCATVRIALAALALACTPAGEAKSGVACKSSWQWCNVDVTDQITKKTTQVAMVTSSKSLYFRGRGMTVKMIVMCVNDHPSIAIETGYKVSYIGLGLRYRVEPQDVVGSARAAHVRSADMFVIEDGAAFWRDLAGGTKLTLEVTLEGEGSTGTTVFDVTGAGAAFAPLGCPAPKSP